MAQGMISEFNGEDGRSGLPKHKVRSKLTASEKLRLGYTTGIEDTDAPLDGGASFRGEMPQT